MPKITIYRTQFCPYCDAAKQLLQDRGIPFEEIDVSHPSEKHRLKEKTGWRTIPQIFIGDELIGGYMELRDLEASGELEKKLGNQ